MLNSKTGSMSRRSLLKSTAAAGAALATGTGGVSLFNVRSAYSQDLPNPADVLAKAHEAGFGDADWARRDPDLRLLQPPPRADRVVQPVRRALRASARPRAAREAAGRRHDRLSGH